MGNEERVSRDKSQSADAPAARAEGAQDAGAKTTGGPGPESSGGEPETAALSPENLVLMLEDARAKADQHWDALLRARAEMDNYRKRSQREVENAHKFGLERFVGELIPVKDSLELGLSAVGEEQADVIKLREGMELTLKMLGTAMDKFGVTEVDPEGEKFDPERHQAMTMQETDTVAPGTVVSVIQKGYLLNDRLVRPALVIVAKQTAAS